MTGLLRSIVVLAVLGIALPVRVLFYVIGMFVGTCLDAWRAGYHEATS